MLVYSAGFSFETDPHVETASSFVESATVHIFHEERGMLGKGTVGLTSDQTFQVFFPFTSLISVNHRIREASSPGDYYEVKLVEPYEDHFEVRVQKVEGR